MAETSKDITACVCPFGLFNFQWISQGLVNIPFTFQRLMDKCVWDMNMHEILVYIYQPYSFWENPPRTEERLIKTMSRLRKLNLKVDPQKCLFFQKSVKHLGHIISKDSVKLDPDKLEALTSWPKPRTVKEVKQYLGFCGYYRRFIKGFSSCVPFHHRTFNSGVTLWQNEPQVLRNCTILMVHCAVIVLLFEITRIFLQ